MASAILFAAAALATSPSAETGQAVEDASPALQTEPQAQTGGSVAALTDDIVVTATKKGTAERLQDVPISITALGQSQLDATFVRSIQDIERVMPGVKFDTVGTMPGYANFTIRGQGINSSIPTIDPTVGVFVDGVYLGVQAGLVIDNFDIEAVEVLRGPQGLLFGRNVTGGAVVLRTTTPGNDFRVNARASLETGLNKTASLAVSGPIVTDKLAAKLAVYFNDDDGWFRNDFDGSSFGKSRQWIVRPALTFTPSDRTQIVLRYEHGEQDGDGPALQQGALFPRDSFDFAINYRGLIKNHWDQATVEINQDVGFGDGTITNVAGYRSYSGALGADGDATVTTQLNFDLITEQEQWSNELRYAGRFGAVSLTTGVYYFTQDLFYIEKRTLAGGATIVQGGGAQKQRTWGVFSSADWSLTDQLTLNLGARYSGEYKRVNVARLTATGCDLAARTCNYTFDDDEKWSAFTPKIGVQWKPTDRTQLYGFYTRGFRSGGYNLRNTDPDVPPGPFGQETQDSFELGLKQSFRRGEWLNVALFNNKVKGLQREILTPGPLGNSQVIRNTADATIRGFEASAQFVLLPGLLVNGQVGYTHGKYKKILFDITGDGVVDAADLALKLPRLTPWTYSIGMTYDQSLGSVGTLSSRVNFSHADSASFTDNNRGFLNPTNMLDASMTLALANSPLSFSIYGKNLLNRVTYGNDTPLPATFAGPGSSQRSLAKGRIIGGEIAYRF